MANSRPVRAALWDVVLVPFPYTDRNAQKRRPALVVSSRDLGSDHGLVWLAMITSADNRGWTGDVAISNQKAAGLPAPSIVRPAKLATVEATHMMRRLGTLSDTDARSVIGSLKRYAEWA